MPKRLIGRCTRAAAAAAAAASLLAAPAPAAAPADFVGAQTSEYAVTANSPPVRTAAGLPQARVGLARTWFWWSEIEVERDVYDFSHYDRVVADAAANRVRLLPIVVVAPRYRTDADRDGGPGRYPPTNSAEMAFFTSILVARYGPSGTFWNHRPDLPRVPIRSWQIWNEPNLWPWWAPSPDPAAYVSLLWTVRGGIKACDPRAEIVAAGLPNSHSYLGPKVAPYLEGMYRAGARGSFDAIAIHPYGNPLSAVYAQIEEARAIMQRFGDAAPIWVTEVGWPDGGPPDNLTVTSARQAELVSQLIGDLHARRASLGIRGVVYYQWADVAAGSSAADNIWNHIGLIDSANQPKPALFAVRDAVDRIGLDPPSTDGPSAVPTSCPSAARRIADTPTDRRSDGRPARQAAIVDRLMGKYGSSVGPRPTVSRARIRPVAFARASHGPAVTRAGRCPKGWVCPGGTLTFKASAAGYVELRFKRVTRGRRRATASPPFKLPVARGSNAFRLTGRARGRPLRRGPQRVLIQLVASGARRSEIATVRFKIRR
jgi:hypothetical protein